MIYFDDKQIKLINSWHNLAANSEEPYMAFMAEWIALNAICYNLYYEKAIIERANIDRGKSKLNKIQEKFNSSNELTVNEVKLVGTSDKWSVDIFFPERLFISISNNYTEDIIFNEFVKANHNWYQDNPSDSFWGLKTSLTKRDRNYVVNMAKIKYYDDSFSVNNLASKNIIILCEENNLKTIKNVLYQIRCNIFHGEKTPGDINDDTIVKCAIPLLRYIVEYLVEKHEIHLKSTTSY
jgi:hypothetical protein